MIELTKLLTSTGFAGFGICSLLFMAGSLFVEKKKFFTELDEAASKIVSIFGIIYFIYYGIYFINYGIDNYNHTEWSWIQIIVYLIISQLLWVNKIRLSKIARIFFSLLLIFPFETLTLLVTSFHRDYVEADYSILKSFVVEKILNGLFFFIVICLWTLIKESVPKKDPDDHPFDYRAKL